MIGACSILFRIKIAAYGGECVWFPIEQALDEQPGFQRLSFPFLSGDKLSLGPGSARDTAGPYTLLRGTYGARSAKVKVDGMKSRAVGH
jgi:hypothetical protein